MYGRDVRARACTRVAHRPENVKCKVQAEHVQRERARVCASPGTLVSLVADSYEKQTIAGHKGGKIKAWKEKAIEKRGGGGGRETRKERRKGQKAPFNAPGSTRCAFSSPTFHPVFPF